MLQPDIIDLTEAMKAAGGATKGVGGIYIPLDGRYGKGPNLLSFSLLGNVRSISCWVTEASENDAGDPHAADAVVRTTSVQLYDGGTKVRIEFSHNWPSPLRVGLQFFFLYT